MTNRYTSGFQIGSEGENGEHLRDRSGWPYSIYREANDVGVSDMVLCHGIQHIDDAEQLLALANGTIRPAIMSPTQMRDINHLSRAYRQYSQCLRLMEGAMTYIRLSIVYNCLTKAWNVRFGDLVLEAVTEKDAYKMADKLATAVRQHTNKYVINA